MGPPITPPSPSKTIVFSKRAKETMGFMNPTLLEKIDKLRDLGIGQHVALPQVRRLT